MIEIPIIHSVQNKTFIQFITFMFQFVVCCRDNIDNLENNRKFNTGLVHELYYQLHIIALLNELYVVQLT